MVYKFTITPDEFSRIGWYWRVYKVEDSTFGAEYSCVASGYTFTKRGAKYKVAATLRAAKKSATRSKGSRIAVEEYVEL